MKLTEQEIDELTAISEGNFGALACLKAIIEVDDAVTRESLLLSIGDNPLLRGSKLYILWNDVCNRNLEIMEMLLRRAPESLIKDSIEGTRDEAAAKIVEWGISLLQATLDYVSNTRDNQ